MPCLTAPCPPTRRARASSRLILGVHRGWHGSRCTSGFARVSSMNPTGRRLPMPPAAPCPATRLASAVSGRAIAIRPPLPAARTALHESPSSGGAQVPESVIQQRTTGRFKSGEKAVMIPGRRTVVFGDDGGGNIRSAVIDDQVPCSGCVGQRVRLETEQPNRFTQVPWSTWSSMIADRLAEALWRRWTVRTARQFEADAVFSRGSAGAIDSLRVSRHTCSG